MSATLNLSREPQYAFASPYSLNLRRKEGKAPAAEMRVTFQHGKSSRTVTVELDQDELCRLIAAAASALTLLREDDKR